MSCATMISLRFKKRRKKNGTHTANKKAVHSEISRHITIVRCNDSNYAILTSSQYKYLNKG